MFIVNYTNISSGSTGTVGVYPGSSYSQSGNVYVRLYLTSSDGQSVYAYKYAGVSNIHYLKSDSGSVVNNKISGVSLSDPYPNPANNSTTFEFTVPESQNVKLELLNELGQNIRLLENGDFDAGTYQHTINTESLSTGIYLYHLVTGNVSKVKRLSISK